MSKSELVHIYTEKIHHLNCSNCLQFINTMDGSHNLTKNQAAEYFKREGWIYKKGTGWLCDKCKSQQ